MSTSKNQLVQRVREGLSKKLSEYPAIMRTRAVYDLIPTKMRRIELLDLNKPADLERWQVIHNTPEKFEVISEKESHQKSEYYIKITYFELGDDQPAVKSKEQLRSEDTGSK